MTKQKRLFLDSFQTQSFPNEKFEFEWMATAAYFRQYAAGSHSCLGVEKTGKRIFW